MTTYLVEKLGGLAGFGGPSARIRSTGTIDDHSLSLKDRDLLQNLFISERQMKFSQKCDEFMYRISKREDGSDNCIEVPESLLPDSIRNCVRDEFA